MALVTVQRSPSPSDTPDTLSSDLGDFVDGESSCRSTQRTRKYISAHKRFRKCLAGIRFVSRLRLSESYVSFKGAALILPQSECLRTVTKGVNTDIHTHLQSMFCLLRPQDTIKMAIKLDSTLENLIRYMAVVSTTGVHDTEECAIIGVDIQQEATIGLVLPVWADMTIKLDGDGGFSITTDSRHHIFKPLSVQAMWSAWQCLNKINDIARLHNYYPIGLTHTWVQYYKITSSQQCINEWDAMEDLESQRSELSSLKSSDAECLERLIRAKLKEVMMTVDLEEVTSKYLRERLEEALEKNLKPYKQFIDQEMIVILRQMDSPSKIFDFLYLGSEWNASNLEELNKNKIGYILNVTREIDNFFPGLFKYKNIRVYDVEEADLLKYWEETYRFISEAKWNNSKVLVHCKMGVSRSASTVISFVMKEKHWSLDEAYNYVKGKRSVIKPNDGFMKQLKMYEGILTASNQRHNKLWRSTSVGNLMPNAHNTQVSREQTTTGTSVPTLSSSLGSHHHHDSLPLLTPQSEQFPDESFDSITVSSDYSFDTSDDDDDDNDVDDDDEPIQFLMEEFANADQLDDFLPSQMSESENMPKSGYQPPADFHYKKTRQHVQSRHVRVPSDSESGTEAQTDVEYKHITGGYDVAVLEAMQEEALAGRMTEDDGSSYKSWSLLHLHPDIVLERTLSHYRNKYIVVKMRKQHSKCRNAQDSCMPVVVVSDSNTALGQRSAAAAVRVKPDDFWIKDEQLTAVSHVESEHAVSAEVNIPTPVSCHLSQSPQPNVTYSSPIGSTTSDTSESIQAYIKEDIPWSPGTVRRHAQDLECRLTTSDAPVLSDVSSSPQCRQRTGSSNTQPTTDANIVSQSVAVAANSPVSDGQPTDQSSWSLTGATTTQSSYHSDGGSTASTSLDSPASSPRQRRSKTVSRIYESEDIQLEPGHVLRTKLQIERSCSYTAMSPDKDIRPVQRSSSCKDERHSSCKGRFDRSSDRRRTCLPVLHPSPTTEKPLTLSSSADNRSSCDNIDDVVIGQKVIYTLGDDALEIEQGKVRRQTRDFEGAVSEDGDSSTKVKPVTDTCVQDEVQVLIRQGSVKRTKQDMLERFGITSKTTSSGDGTQPQNSSVLVRGTSSLTSEQPDEQTEQADRQLIVPSNHKKLKHSQSSPQLCLGAPAYPTEEEITWSVGTVLRQKEAIERKGSNLGEKSGDKQLKSSLDSETLNLIRQVGTAWLESAERRASCKDTEVQSGPGLVRRLSYQMQGKSASEEIKKRMLMLEKKISDTSDGTFSNGKSGMSRSASMRESSRLKAVSVHRTRSVKEQLTASVQEKCFTIKEGKPITKSGFVCQITSKVGSENAEETDVPTSQISSEALPSKELAEDFKAAAKKQGGERKSSTKEVKHDFEASMDATNRDSKVQKSYLRRTKSDGLRNVPSDGVFKSSISVNVSSAHPKDSSDMSDEVKSQTLVSQTGRSILVKTISDSQHHCHERRNVSGVAVARAVCSDSALLETTPSYEREDKFTRNLKSISATAEDNSDSSYPTDIESAVKGVRSFSEVVDFDVMSKTSRQSQGMTSKHGLTQTRSLPVTKKQSGSFSHETSAVKVSSVSEGTVTGILGTGRKRAGSKKDAVSEAVKEGDIKQSEQFSCSVHKHSGFDSEPQTEKVHAESQVKSETVGCKDVKQSAEQPRKAASKSSRFLARKSRDIKDLLNMFEEQKLEPSDHQKLSPQQSGKAIHSIKGTTETSEPSGPSHVESSAGQIGSDAAKCCDESTTVVLNPVIKEQAIKTLFLKQKSEEKASACHMGVQGTRRHRRSAVPTRQGHNGAGRAKVTATEHYGKHHATSTESSCQEKEQLQKMRKLNGKSHPLTKLTQVENTTGPLIQGRCKNPFYNSL